MISLPPQLLETYLQRRKVDIDELTRSLEADSVEAFNRIGHQLAGNAMSFGFPALEVIGSQMEDLDKMNLQEKGPLLIREFSNWLAEVSQNKISRS